MRSFDPDVADEAVEVVAPDEEGPGRDLRDEDLEAAAELACAALDAVTDRLAAAERREGQRQMAGAVAAALAAERHLVVEAGTGVGKSLAYLVPIVAAGRRTVVATATKALQDQLWHHELPALRAGGLDVRAAVLKGRQNYLCQRRLADLGEGAATATLGAAVDEPRGVATQLRRIARWAETTERGELDDLGFEPDPRAWARVSMPAEECPGADRCQFGATCFAEAAKRRAEQASVVIVNSALYGAHLSTGRTLLPSHEVVVFDEAHELDHHLTRSLGVEVNAGRLRAVAGLVRAAGSADAAVPAQELALVADRLATRLAERAGGDDPVGLDPGTRAVLDDAARATEALLATFEGTSAMEPARLSARGAAVHLRGDLVRLRDPGGDDLVFVEGGERHATLVRAPIELGPHLRELWDEVVAVLCSATIPERLEDRLGLPGDRRTRLSVPSPFDYRSHALLYVPRHLPERRDPACEAAMAAELGALVGAAGGRTLALFTSHRALREVGAAVRELVTTPVLLQGEGSRAVLLQQFADDEATSLFATMGFWQGVDVPGRTLSLLVVDRLPFGRPDDPMLEARRERAGRSAFSTVDLPRAAMLLAQGVGRLIRTAEDRGVVCVLDTRLATATYRGALLRRLPPMRRSTSREEAVAFLTEVTAHERLAARGGP